MAEKRAVSANASRERDAIARALKIARRIAMREDVAVRERIERFKPKPRYAKRELCIAKEAWRKVAAAGIKRRLVFAHPDLLKAIPEASLHYRGIALLSRKRVQEIAGSVDNWERSPAKARVSEQKALKVSRLYNAVISAILLDSTDWTLDDGYRNILATVGITEDGAMRNIIGQEAEQAIKDRLLDWVSAQRLLIGETSEPRSDWTLQGGVLMRFGSEPDISFERDGKLAVLIEIKGGKDPAGALERLGAVKKTFDETPVDCKNFLVAGVVTTTMRERLEEMRIEDDFDIESLLHDDRDWARFLNEVFHHALRLTAEVPP